MTEQKQAGWIGYVVELVLVLLTGIVIGSMFSEIKSSAEAAAPPEDGEYYIRIATGRSVRLRPDPCSTKTEAEIAVCEAVSNYLLPWLSDSPGSGFSGDVLVVIIPDEENPDRFLIDISESQTKRARQFNITLSGELSSSCRREIERIKQELSLTLHAQLMPPDPPPRKEASGGSFFTYKNPAICGIIFMLMMITTNQKKAKILSILPADGFP